MKIPKDVQKNMEKLSALQKKEDTKADEKIINKYGLKDDRVQSLIKLIQDTYGTDNTINLVKQRVDKELELKPIFINTIKSTIPKLKSPKKTDEKKDETPVVVVDLNEFKKSLDRWINLVDLFTPKFFDAYITKDDGVVVISFNLYKYLNFYFKSTPTETYSYLPNGMAYQAKHGAWKLFAKGELKKRFNQHLSQTLIRWGKNNVEYINKETRQLDQQLDQTVFNSKAPLPDDLMDTNLVAFNNGTYNFANGTVQHHSKNNYLMNIHDYWVDFDNPIAPETDKLLKGMMGDADTFFKEFIGYSFYPRHDVFQDFIFLHGQAGEGKSTLLNYLITSLFGKDNTSALDPQTIADRNDKFATSDLYRKELNVVPDISDGMLKDINALKGLVGGDYMRAQFKGQDSFKFASRAKNIWSANTLPSIKANDASRAIKDRVNVIEFINGDTRDANNDFWQHHDMNKVRSERPQFVAECLNLFHKVLQRHKEGQGRDSWTRTESIRKATNHWLKTNDPIGLWLESVRDENPSLLQDGYFVKDNAYSDYKIWCEGESRTPMNKGNLGKQLTSRFGFEDKRVKMPDGSFPRVWSNQDLKEQWNKGEHPVNEWNKKRGISIKE